MNRLKSQTFLKPFSDPRFIGFIAVIVFALIGSLYLLLSSHAATPTAAFEVESGTLATNAQKVTDTTASGSSGVKFTTATGGSVGSCPAFPSFPDASCTGVPTGTALTTKNGNQTVSTAGTVINGWDIYGKLIINANNVTVKNSRIHGPAAGSCQNGAGIEIYGSNATIQDTEVLMDNPTACLDGVWMNGNYGTLLRVNIHGSTDGVKIGPDNSGHDYLIQDSYIHDMLWWASDPNQSGGADSTHNDAIQILQSTNIQITHNRLAAAGTDPNSATQIGQDFGVIGTVSVDHNYLDYGGCTVNIAQKDKGPMNGVSVTNNHFGHHQGFSNCTVLIGTQVTLAAYSGNVWDDTGQPIPPIQQHD